MAEDIITTEEISQPIINMLQIFGCNPKKKTILGTIIFWIFASTGSVYTICAIIKCIEQTTLETFSVTYIDFLVASQTTFKTLTLFFNQERLDKLFDIFWNEFWPVNKILDLTKQHNRMYRIIMKGTKIYRGILVCCIVQISINALTLPIRALPYNLYFLGYEYSVLLTTPYYQLTYVFELLTMSVPYVLCLIGHDMIYIAMCGCAIVQFDMLKAKLLEIGEDDDENKSYEILKECVKHHNMILKFVKDLETVVTLAILKQYMDAITCMGIYIYLSQQEFHFLYVFSLLTNLSQTLFFSSFGQMIQDRSLGVGDASYDSKWHLLSSRRVHQGLILVILRAQRRTKFSAGGFISLSFESFVGMLKTAGSFLAVLRSTKE